jgi:hypothetical protein
LGEGTPPEQENAPATSVCGGWASGRSDDTFGKGAVSGPLFDATPTQCEAIKPHVMVEVKSCSITPRRIQKSIISVFDIEGIADTLKAAALLSESNTECAPFLPSPLMSSPFRAPLPSSSPLLS